MNPWAVAGLLFIFVFPPTYWVLTADALTAVERAGYLALFLGAEALGFALFFFDMWILEKLFIGVTVLY